MKSQTRLPESVSMLEGGPAPRRPRRWWPGDQEGWCLTLYIYLMAIFSLPMILALKTRVAPGLFKYYEHAVQYIQLPFP